jgi:hypothetical protein
MHHRKPGDINIQAAMPVSLIEYSKRCTFTIRILHNSVSFIVDAMGWESLSTGGSNFGEMFSSALLVIFVARHSQFDQLLDPFQLSSRD